MLSLLLHGEGRHWLTWGQGLLTLADPGNVISVDCWQQCAVANNLLLVPSAMRWNGEGWGPVAHNAKPQQPCTERRALVGSGGAAG